MLEPDKFLYRHGSVNYRNGMQKSRAVQISDPSGPLELVPREIPEPGPGQIRIKVQACGVCHSDAITKQGLFPGIAYPRVPGHEVVGLVDAIGTSAGRWRPGQRVGVGWHGGHCGICNACRRGDFLMCEIGKIPGISYDGGYADYMLAPAEAVAVVPETLANADAAPLLCAGITTFNALRHSGAIAGELVAVLGMGGLGHLGVQFAAKMGFRTAAIARGADKAAFAAQLGAHHYIDSLKEDVAQTLTAMGGARVVLATATNADAVTAAIGGLGHNGVLVLVGVPDNPLMIPALPLILRRQSVRGWPSGTATDSEDTLAFSALTGVRPIIERYPLERAAEAYDRMISGSARFRVVLETGA